LDFVDVELQLQSRLAHCARVPNSQAPFFGCLALWERMRGGVWKKGTRDVCH